MDKTDTQKQAGSRDSIQYRIELVHTIGRNINYLFKYGAYVILAIWWAPVVQEFAGQTTAALIGLKAEVNGTVTIATSTWVTVMAIIFGLSGILYGQRQARLRKKTVANMSDQLKECEKQLDSKRTSSNLTKSGDTHPGDA